MAENVSMDYLVGIYEKAFPERLSIGEMLGLANQTGFDFFEINIDRTEKRIARLYDDGYPVYLLREMSRANCCIQSLGLSALSTYTLGSSDKETESRALDIFQHAVLFALKTGIRIVQIPGCDVPKNGKGTEETNRRFFKNLECVAKYAAKNGVLIGIENMENPYMDTVAKCMHAIESVHSPYLQLYPDSGNSTNAWNNHLNRILADMEQGAGHYIAYHLKEVQADRYGGLFYGEGHVDFSPLVRKAYELGARRFVMEYWYTGNDSWDDDLRRARKLCDAWLNGDGDDG